MKSRKRIRRLPLHAQVTQTLRHEIQKHCQPGQRLDSEDKLAEQLGVSLLTLRHGLGVLAHEGLVERRQGSGTYVADPRTYQCIAIATATYPDQPMTAFHMRLFALLGEKFKRAGYQCRFYTAPVGLIPGWSELIQDAERGLIAGTTFIGMNPHSIPLKAVTDKGIPYVGGEDAPSVDMDYKGLVHDGIRHLMEKGCRRIALMQWYNPWERGPSYDAFRAGMAELGAVLREEWIRWGIPPSQPGAGWAHFREIWTSHKEKPDGLLVTDDMLFRDVAMAILECGIKVPRQLRVVTHANKGSGLTYPFPVDRLEIDVDEWAEAMMRQLIALINREKSGAPAYCIRPRLIPAEAEVQSAAAAPSGAANSLSGAE